MAFEYLKEMRFIRKWGTDGASLVIEKAVSDTILSEPMQDQLLDIAKDLRELLSKYKK